MDYEISAPSGESKTLEGQVAAIVETIADANLRAYFAGCAHRHSATKATWQRGLSPAPWRARIR